MAKNLSKRAGLSGSRKNTKTPNWLPAWEVSSDGEVAYMDLPSGGGYLVMKGELAEYVEQVCARESVTLQKFVSSLIERVGAAV
jgi:hypothetical protein